MAGFNPGASPPPVSTPTRFVLAMSDSRYGWTQALILIQLTIRQRTLTTDLFRTQPDAKCLGRATGPSTRECGPASTAHRRPPSASRAFADRLRSVDAVVRARLRIRQPHACTDPFASASVVPWTFVVRQTG